MRRISGRIHFSASALLVATIFRCVGADAQALVHFDLPAQPLARSLKAIGTATNTDVGFSASQVAGFIAPPLKDNLTLDGALTRVLVGTGLRPQHLNDHAIVIAPVESSTSDATERNPLLMKVSELAEADDQTTAPQVPAQTNSTDASSSASAQENDLDEIVVTGSHIRGIANKTSPVIVIGQAQIQQSGYSSTQDLFQSLPQNFASGNTTQAGFLGNGTNNYELVSGINLRGLGASSTLVLLNGHRIAPAEEGSVVDVSSIPLSAIDHIDILTDGSSAIYGSDAVGGVVNIILKQNFDGAESSIRYGRVTDGGRDELAAAQAFGSSWSSGNAVGTFQYQRHSALDANDRDFAAQIASPTDLLPKDHAYSATLNARQQLTDGVEGYSDLLWSKRYFDQNYSAAAGSGVDNEYNNGNLTTINASAGVRYKLAPKWSVELNGLYAGQNSDVMRSLRGFFYPMPKKQLFESTFDERSIELILKGRLATTAAGDVGIAVGGSYMNENPAYRAYTNGKLTFDLHPDRNIKAYYGEIYVPLVEKQNSILFIQALEISAAVRTDNYSDFGSTTNPRFGARWSPATGVSLRASYGRSFRAPTESELSAGASSAVVIESFAKPNGSGTLPMIVLDGGKALSAERAKTLDFGVEYQPVNLQGVDFTLNYYDIRYVDRIVQIFPPANALQSSNIYGQLITNLPSDAAAQSYVDSAVAKGAQYFDFVGTGTTGVRYAFDSRLQNASIVRQSGVDFIASWARTFSAGNLTAQANATFVDKIDTAYSTGASFANLVSTYGNPPKWRSRENLAWATVGWEINGAISTVGSYVNTAGLGNPAVSAWTTIDLGARLHADAYLTGSEWKGVTVGISVLNAFDRNPPYIKVLSGAPLNYDPNNASPLGRFISLELRKKW